MILFIKFKTPQIIMEAPSPALDHISNHTYQTTSEGSDHSLLGHSHQCLCPNDHTQNETPNIIEHCHQKHHHLNVINQLAHHPHHQIRASVHASPKSGTKVSARIIQTKQGQERPQSCCVQCCAQAPVQQHPEIHEANIVQNRKLDADENCIEVLSQLPPALPPRPPPRQRTYELTAVGSGHMGMPGSGIHHNSLGARSLGRLRSGKYLNIF